MSDRRTRKTPERRQAILDRRWNKAKLPLYQPVFFINEVVTFTNDPELKNPKKRFPRNFKQRRIQQITGRWVMVSGCTYWVHCTRLVRVPKRKIMEGI